MTIETATISAGNTFTNPVTVTDKSFTLSVKGVSDSFSTVTLQRKRVADAVGAYRDVDEYCEDIEDNGDSIGEWQYRLGCKSDAHVSGAIVVEIEG